MNELVRQSALFFLFWILIAVPYYVILFRLKKDLNIRIRRKNRTNEKV